MTAPAPTMLRLVDSEGDTAELWVAPDDSVRLRWAILGGDTLDWSALGPYGGWVVSQSDAADWFGTTLSAIRHTLKEAAR